MYQIIYRCGFTNNETYNSIFSDEELHFSDFDILNSDSTNQDSEPANNCIFFIEGNFFTSNIIKGLSFFRRKYNCDVIIHEKDYEGLRKGYTDLPDGINHPFKSATRFINSRKIILPFQKFPPCPKAIPVSDGVILKKYGINARILSTPGHTDGSISIIVDEEIALVGDCMVRSVNGEIFPPFAKHPEEVTRSWIKLINTGCRFFLPAHGNENSSEYVRKKMKKQLNTIMLKRIK